MQALSFAAHIPLVCFGIAFPALRRLRRVAAPAHRRRGLPRARAALVEGDARPVRRRSRHGHDPELRAGPAVAELHGDVRRRLRPRLHDRGHLVLRRGDLHRDLRLRLEPAVAARAPAHRDPDHPLGLQRLADGDRRQRLDEPSHRLHAEERPRRRRAPVRGPVREQLLLARADPHVHRGLHGRGLPDRERVRVGPAARPQHPLQPHGADHPADGRRARLADPDRRRRLGRARRREDAAGQAGGARRARRRRRRARPSTCSGGTTGTGSSTASRSRSCSRCSPSTTRTRRWTDWTPFRSTTARP